MDTRRTSYMLFIGMAVLAVGAIVMFDFLIRSWTYGYVKEELALSTRSAINAVQRSDMNTDIRSIEGHLEKLYGPDEHIRYTITAEDGVVLGDSVLSYEQVLATDNHGDREEIRQAIAEGIGYSIRYSSTQNTNVMYYVLSFEYKGLKATMRSAKPLLLVDMMGNEIEVLILGIFVFFLVVMACMTLIINRRLEKNLQANNDQMEAQVFERTKEVEILQRLANMLAACNTMIEAQQVVEDIVPRLLGDLNGAVSLIRASRNQLEVKLDWGGKWPGLHQYSPSECWAMRKGKFHLSNDQFSSLSCSHMDGVSNEQTLCIPLVAHGETMGVMHLYVGHKLTDDQLRLSFIIGEHLGLAMANLSLQEKLKEQAIRDPLTGLHNRRFMEEAMGYEMMRARRAQKPLSLLMLDMDHFKRFNDNFGHDAGDFVLKSLASLLKETLRGEDIICRIGGEELAVLLPVTALPEAEKVADKLCTLVRDLHLDFHNVSLGSLTLSIGVAEYPIDGDSAESLIKAADTALYAAKANGRDQFCSVVREHIKTAITEDVERAEPVVETH